MSFKLLKLLLRTGKFLRVTPPLSNKDTGFLQRSYILGVFFTISVGVIMSTLYKKCYLQYIHIKIIISFLEDIALYTLNFYASVVLNFWKAESWFHLMENLKATESLTSAKREKLPYYFGFLLLNIVYWVLALHEIIIWYRLTNLDYFLKQYFIVIIQLYLKFFCTFLLNVVTNMLLSRYRGVKLLLLNFLRRKKKFGALNTLDMMHQTETIVHFLKKTVDMYNEIFGFPIFLTISFTTLHILNYVHYTIFYSNRFEVLDMIILNIGFLTWNLVGAVTLITLCDLVQQEGEKILTLSYKLHVQCHTVEDVCRFESFLQLISNNLPKFTAAKFFYIRRSTILDMLNTVYTFLIIMIQFEAQ
ncbi:gustatory receptor 36 [Tribolium castaneum]|uniref:Gustatory receptor n=1 Tax=Tribolium castaneum TaxID=7070 RepID=D2A3D6_TRICA|nr:gustatory receptor 36 [Tribolium castaneum]